MAGNAAEIRRGVYLKIRDEFNFNNVTGLSSLPPITQRATHKLEDPFIYIWSESQIEQDITKNGESYEYAVRIEISTKANSNRGGQLQSDQMAGEIYRIFDVQPDQYPDIRDKGYNIYIVKFAETASFVEEVRGGTYFRKVITLLVTADFVGFDGTSIPVQNTSYSFNDWRYLPTTLQLERYDAGTIIPQTTYPNLSSGWDFIDSTFTIAAGAQGTFTNDIYTLGSTDEPVALASTLNYRRETTPTIIDLLPAGGRTEYNFSGDSSWYFADSNGLILGITDGTTWANAGINRITIRGDIGATTIADGTSIRATLPNGAFIEFDSSNITIAFGSTLVPIAAISSSSGVIEGCSVPGLPTALQLTSLTEAIQNYALMGTTTWDRIGSLRYGVIESTSQPLFTDDTAASTGLRDLGNFQSSDDTIDFGTVNPVGTTITFKGVEGQWMYMIIDKSQANITALIDAFNEDNLSFFEDPIVIGEYKVYVQKRALSFTSNLTFTIQ